MLRSSKSATDWLINVYVVMLAAATKGIHSYTPCFTYKQFNSINRGGNDMKPPRRIAFNKNSNAVIRTGMRVPGRGIVVTSCTFEYAYIHGRRPVTELK